MTLKPNLYYTNPEMGVTVEFGTIEYPKMPILLASFALTAHSMDLA